MQGLQCSPQIVKGRFHTSRGFFSILLTVLRELHLMLYYARENTELSVGL